MAIIDYEIPDHSLISESQRSHELKSIEVEGSEPLGIKPFSKDQPSAESIGAYVCRLFERTMPVRKGYKIGHDFVVSVLAVGLSDRNAFIEEFFLDFVDMMASHNNRWKGGLNHLSSVISASFA